MALTALYTRVELQCSCAMEGNCVYIMQGLCGVLSTGLGNVRKSRVYCCSSFSRGVFQPNQLPNCTYETEVHIAMCVYTYVSYRLSLKL